MKVNELIEKIESLLHKFEKDNNVIVSDICVDTFSINVPFEKENVIDHRIELTMRKNSLNKEAGQVAPE